MSSTITIWEVLVILFLHWVGDFVMQSDQQAKNKSTDNAFLLAHIMYYTAIFIIPIAIYMATQSNQKMILFYPITFAAHYATDWYTSRVNSQLWKDGKSHDFFVSIGFDQLLHFAQLLITYQILK